MVHSQFWIPQDALGEFISKMITGSSNVVHPQFTVDSSLPRRCRPKRNSIVQRLETNKPPSRLHTRQATLLKLHAELENPRKSVVNMPLFILMQDDCRGSAVADLQKASLFSLGIKAKTFQRDLSCLTKRTSRIYHEKKKTENEEGFFAAFCSRSQAISKLSGSFTGINGVCLLLLCNELKSEGK